MTLAHRKDVEVEGKHHMPEFLEQTEHRPWSLPETEWIWRQSWLDLAFIHVPVEAEIIQSRLPEGVRVDVFDESAWLGIVPFQMSGVKRRNLPAFPFMRQFPELNLRTYVVVNDKPGVWFFSLDAASLPLVLGGRLVYGLPYYRARMKMGWENGTCRFESFRRSSSMNMRCQYEPTSEVFYSEAGTFEHWATERYCLYSQKRPSASVCRAEVHHAPWPMQRAEVRIDECSILSAAGFDVSLRDPVCHFSTGVDVVSFPVEQISD